MSATNIGKYRLIAELGQGGMADVFLAVATGPAGLGFSKLVVIKRLREHLASDPEFVAMLIDEARIAARLNHPNVVQTIEIGEADGQYFLAMEYLDGQALRTILKRFPSGAEGFPQHLRYFVLQRVLAGLHHAHELADYDRSPLNIVHRDVSPHNVFVTYDGQVKVVDFGVAKAAGRIAETRHGVVKGKVVYMAPEQAVGEHVDRRADVFAVGVMLWEIAVGARMWAGERDEKGVFRRLIKGALPDSPRIVRPDVPEAIDAICRRALAIKPDNRYSTAAEFEAALARFLQDDGQQPSERELGMYVAAGFPDAREKAKTIIDEQLRQISATSGSSGSSPELSPLSTESLSTSLGSGPGSGPSPTGSVPSASVRFEDLPRAQDQTSTTQVGPELKKTLERRPQPPEPTQRRGTMIAATVAVGALALGVAAWAALNRAPKVTTVPLPPLPEAAPPPSASQAPLADVMVRFRATPAETHFFIDDGPPLPNPYLGHHAMDHAQHRVSVAAPGCSTVNKVVTFDDDVALQLSLSCLPPGPQKPRR